MMIEIHLQYVSRGFDKFYNCYNNQQMFDFFSIKYLIYICATLQCFEHIELAILL